MSDEALNVTTVTVLITLANLPCGSHWEDDGSSWSARPDPMEPKGWRWWPNNALALAKDGPEGEMTDIPPGCLDRLFPRP